MERVLLIDGIEDIRGKQVFTDLFGNEVAFVSEDEIDKPTVSVSTKLTQREYDAVEGWAFKFGKSRSKFLRDCIIQQLRDLYSLLEL